MKKIFILSLAALALLSACKKDPLTDTTNSFTATIEQSGDKTTLNGYSVEWVNGDAIIVNGETLTTNGPTGDNHTQTTFTSENTVALNGSTPNYKAYYPASYYHDGAMHLPATQDYDATTNGISNLPMYAQSDDHDLVFKNLCGVLAITVNSSDFTSVSSIDVYSNTWMNGAFTVDASDNYSMTFTGTIADANKKVTLSMGTTPVSITTSQVFYIAIPAGTHNLIIKVNGNNTSKVMATKAANGITIVRNKIYSIAFAENAIQLWANGPYWATVNVGATISSYDNVTTYTTANVGGMYSWGGTNERRSGTNTDDKNTGTVDLTDANNTATQLWGSNWRMPDKDQLKALIHGQGNCTWYWCTGSGSSQYASGCTLTGYKVTGDASAYASNSIFLPAAGYLDGSEIIRDSFQGYYWSMTKHSESGHSNDYAYALHFNHDSHQNYPKEVYAQSHRYRARCVRAILNLPNNW